MRHTARTQSPGDTTYYIDPAAGDDRHAGTSTGQAWRSFAPVSRLALSAGDRIEVTSPGAFEQGLSLHGRGSGASPIVVRFAPGRYDLFPIGGPVRRYDISNCNASPEADKSIGILVEGSAHVRVEGHGAQLVCRGKMIEVCVDHSESVSVEGLAIDYHRPTVSEMTAVTSADTHADLRVHGDSFYRVEDGRLVWQGEGWHHEDGLAQEFDPDTARVWRRPGLLAGLRVEELAPNRIRVHGDHNIAVGRVFQIRDPFRDCVGVLLNRSRDVVFRNVDLLFMHGMGVLSQFTENITFDSVSIAPDPTSGRTTAAWADCFHASGCRGQITVSNCTFRGAHDDAINIHGTYLRVVERPGGRQLRVRFMHHQTYGFIAFHAGDEVAVVRAGTLEVIARRRVVRAELVSPREMLLTLERDLDSDLHEHDVVENLTWTPRVDLINCHVSHIPTRGFLVSTPRPVRITGNTFDRTYMSGVLLACDAKDWFESGPVRDVLIADNRFNRCRKSGVLIAPNTDRPDVPVNRNVRITGNTFVLDGDPAVVATRCAGLTIQGNKATAAGNQVVYDIDPGCTDVTCDGA